VAPLIAPFFRASVAMGRRERELFSGALTDDAFAHALRGMDAILRQNVRRLLAAALLADAVGGRLAFVEGWRSNTIEGRGRAHVVTGSWWLAAFLRLLRRRGLVPRGPRPIRRDLSRCTWEEARALLSTAGGAGVIGVSDLPCPSAARARRYLRGGTVLAPEHVLDRAPALTAAQRRVWEAVQPRPAEAMLAPFVEIPNWVLHGVSEIVSRPTRIAPPVEARLARALRRDLR
jgi:hypothetical protein